MHIKSVIVLLMAILFIGHASLAADLKQGLSYYKSGEYNKSETFFKRALLDNPSDNTAKYMLAATLVQIGKYDEAKKYYRSVIVDSTDIKLVSLSKSGLRNLGEDAGFHTSRSLTRATINISTAGTALVVNDVKLNGKLKTDFILDTGATFTMISRKTAQNLGISTNNTDKVKIMTGSGYISAPLVIIPKIEVKGLVVRNVETIVADLPSHGSGDGGGIAGLLGLSFLENFKVTVDRARGQVTLEKN